MAQGVRAPGLDVCAVADVDVDSARRAFEAAGVPAYDVVRCETAADVRTALAAGRRVVAADAEILLDHDINGDIGLDIDVVVEATGAPEAGARHARRAIEHGRHVAMVTKEADAAVGPILRRLADRAGVAYLPVDGDQHGLLIGLVAWARSVGLDVLCGGKALDGELVVTLPPDHACFAPAAGGEPLRAAVAERAERLGPVGGAKPWDLTELTIAANATGLVPDRPGLHCPAAWASEIPAALCPAELGGLLGGGGRVDAVQVVRQPHEAGLSGGVFVVVRAENASKPNLFHVESRVDAQRAGTALVTHPQHLMGIEAVSTLLAAGLLGPAAGAELDYRPRYDVVYRATRPLRAGDRIGDDHSPDLTAELVPAAPVSPTAPLPTGLAAGNALGADVPAGALVTAGAVVRPARSDLWELRAEQDAHFHPPH